MLLRYAFFHYASLVLVFATLFLRFDFWQLLFLEATLLHFFDHVYRTIMKNVYQQQRRIVSEVEPEQKLAWSTNCKTL